MIYILNEQIMNGTVTLQILTSGIEADTFKLAVEHLKQLPFFKKVDRFEQKDDGFHYYVKSDSFGYDYLVGYLKNKSLEFV